MLNNLKVVNQMINISEIRKRIEELFPVYLRGKLESEQYKELVRALNDVVREARKDENDFIPEEERPEIFLLKLFKPVIKDITRKIWSKYETFQLEEWEFYAQQAFISIVLSDACQRYYRKTAINDYFDSKTKVQEYRHLDLNSLHSVSHRDNLLGQSGSGKNPNYLEEYAENEHEEACQKKMKDFEYDEPWEGLEDVKGDGFLIRDRVAQEVAKEFALKYKGPRKGRAWDEPTGFDPDYKPPELRDLLNQKKMADLALNEWHKGEFPEIGTEEECIKWIESVFIDIPMGELEKRIRDFPGVQPDFILWIRGKNGQRGHLKRMLLNFFKSWIDNRSMLVYDSELINEELEEDLEEVERTEKYFATKHTALDALLEKDLPEKLINFSATLSKEQNLVWQLMLQGKKNHEIVQDLKKSLRNVEIHKKNIQKLFYSYIAT